MKKVSVGLVGLGGYAGIHLMALRTLQSAQLCHIVAACDPFAERHPATVAALRAEGVEIYSDLHAMLARDDIDAVTIATPIHLHATQTRAALAAGKSVYLEKPPCATLEELDAMIAAQGEVRSKPSLLSARVGFQTHTSAALRWLKAQLASGEWGALHTISASVRWNRNDAYYNRSSWAATWRQNGVPVFDGPATNALAHVVFAALFLGGEELNAVASPLRVRGSLMRARPIESYDSALIDAELPRGVRLRLALTHASTRSDEAVLHLDCKRARVSFSLNNEVRIDARDGSEPEILDFQQANAHTAMLDFLRAVALGERGWLPTLEDTRGYVQLTCGALQSSAANATGGAQNFAATSQAGENSERIFVADGLDEQMQTFARNADALPTLFAIESKPWIAAHEIAPTLAV